MSHTGLYSFADPTGHISKLGGLKYVTRNSKNGKIELKPCSSKGRLLLSVFVTIVSFIILVSNYTVLKKPVIPIPGLKLAGSVMVVPYTSFDIPVSGLLCESITLNRPLRDNSAADTQWNVSLFLEHGPESIPRKSYNFSIFNEYDIPLNSFRSMYMRYIHLRAGSSFAVYSCVDEGDPKSVKVCVLKGQGSYKQWLSDQRNCKGQEYQLNSCTSNGTNTTSWTDINDTDTYYFVHYSFSANESSSIFMDISVSSLDYDFSFIEPNISCEPPNHIYTSACVTPSLPLGFRGRGIITAIVAVSNDRSASFEDNLHVSWECNVSFKTYLMLCIPYLVIVACFNIGNLCLAFRKEYKCCGSKGNVPEGQDVPEGENEGTLQRYCNRLPCNPIEVVKKIKNNVKTKVCIFITSFIVVILSITCIEAIVPVIRYRTGLGSSYVMTPSETRLFPINKFFCSSLTIDVVGNSHLSASLWITETKPELNTSTDKTIEFSLTCYDLCGQDWRFYMNPGSTFDHIIVDNSYYSNGDVYFQVFTGEVKLLTLVSQASTIKGGEQTPFHVANPEGTYVVKFFTQGEEVTQSELDFEIVRTEYFVEPDLPQCETHSYTTTSCNVPIPFGAGNINVLLKVAYDRPEDIIDTNRNYFEYLTVNTKCNYRVGAWTLVWLPILIFNFVVFVGIFLALLRWKAKYAKVAAARDNARAPLTDNTVAPSTDNRGSDYGSTWPNTAPVTESPVVQPNGRSNDPAATGSPVSGASSHVPAAISPSVQPNGAPPRDLPPTLHPVTTGSQPNGTPSLAPAAGISPTTPSINEGPGEIVQRPNANYEGETPVVHAVAEVLESVEEEYPASSETDPLIV